MPPAQADPRAPARWPGGLGSGFALLVLVVATLSLFVPAMTTVPHLGTWLVIILSIAFLLG